MTALPAPKLGSDCVIFEPDDDRADRPWVAMRDESTGVRFPTEAEALVFWHLTHPSCEEA
jgi:hypothetical protein